MEIETEAKSAEDHSLGANGRLGLLPDRFLHEVSVRSRREAQMRLHLPIVRMGV
jgi:hypothetical protein